MMDHQAVGLVAVLAGVLFVLYTYVGYPLILLLLGFFRERPWHASGEPAEWPRIGIGGSR